MSWPSAQSAMNISLVGRVFWPCWVPENSQRRNKPLHKARIGKTCVQEVFRRFPCFFHEGYCSMDFYQIVREKRLFVPPKKPIFLTQCAIFCQSTFKLSC